MLPRVALTGCLLIALLAGCVGDDTPDLVEGGPLGAPGYLYEGLGQLFAGEALYRDPQNAPHPAYNWPTLSNPAVGPDLPRWWKPNNGTSLPAAFTGLELVGRANVQSGAGIALFGSLAVVPSFSAAINSTVVDISDPGYPHVIGEMQGINSRTGQGLSHRGATIIAYPTGRLVTVISTGALLDVWDITDPTSPKQLPQIFPSEGSHKVGVVPGTPFVYNANSDGADRPDLVDLPIPLVGGVPDPSGNLPGEGLGFVEIYDLSDPDEPDPTNRSLVQKWQNGYGCHHLYFWNDAAQDKSRGVCAAIEFTQIWDTADPAHPTVIESIPFGSGGTPAGDSAAVVFPASLSHYAGLSQDGTILIMGDESGGGATPPGCTVRADVPGVGSVSMPVGALWFYDISVETEPELLGWYSASQADKLTTGGDAPTSCTAHHGRLVPYEDRDVLAMSFYGSGVIVIDFTALRNEQGGVPTTVAQFADGSDTWETWYYNGHLYTGDLKRGMDVLAFTP